DGLVMTATGTVEDWHPDWSPDGTQLVFTSNLNGSTDIFIAQSEGSGYQQITNDYDRDSNPIWASTDEIIFVSDREGYSRIYRMNLDGTDIRPLTPKDWNTDSPAWYP
ncbi:MAG: PD40 domain-containing protein, partial [Armatimonadetes bacterium]|nr:PD40 domain-containing protein [Anaerolineae bacterium]